MKKILAILVIVIIIGLVIWGYFNSKITDISWKKFKPFTESKYIKQVTTNKLELVGNLPKIEAATQFYPLASGIVQNIYNKNSYNDELLKCVSTDEAYEDLLNGNTDIIIVTKPNDNYKKQIQMDSERISKVVIYKEPMIVFVNKKNTIKDISLKDLKRIYNENKLTWKSFGGNQNTIKTYQLQEDNDSQICINSIIENNENNDYHITLHSKMSKIIDKVGNDRNGIGYSFNQYLTRMHINSKVKGITIDGKEPSDKDYPLLTDVYIMYNSSNTNKNVKFIVNYLQSSEGRKLVKNLL